MVAGNPNERADELQRLRRALEARDDRLAEKEREIFELNKSLRKLEDLRLISEARAARLAEREREVSELKLELARRNRISAQARGAS